MWARRLLLFGNTDGCQTPQRSNLRQTLGALAAHFASLTPDELVALISSTPHPNPEARLLILSILARRGDEAARRATAAQLESFSSAELLTFVTVHRTTGGSLGKRLRRCISRWYSAQEPARLARNLFGPVLGCTHKHVLCLSHVSPTTPSENLLYNCAIFGFQRLQDSPNTPLHQLLSALHHARRTTSPDEAIALIREFTLEPRHVAPALLRQAPVVWGALARTTPLSGLLENFGALVASGALNQRGADQMELLRRISSQEEIKSEDIHPFLLYSCQKMYARGFKGRYRRPNNRPVARTLEQTFLQSLDHVQPTGLRWVVAVDNAEHMHTRPARHLAHMFAFDVALGMSALLLHTEPAVSLAVSGKYDFEALEVSSACSLVELRRKMDGTRAPFSLSRCVTWAEDSGADVLLAFTSIQHTENNASGGLLLPRVFSSRGDQGPMRVICVVPADKPAHVPLSPSEYYLEIAGFSPATARLITDFAQLGVS